MTKVLRHFSSSRILNPLVETLMHGGDAVVTKEDLVYAEELYRRAVLEDVRLYLRIRHGEPLDAETHMRALLRRIDRHQKACWRSDPTSPKAMASFTIWTAWAWYKRIAVRRRAEWENIAASNNWAAVPRAWTRLAIVYFHFALLCTRLLPWPRLHARLEHFADVISFVRS